jgi:hypothetical protein
MYVCVYVSEFVRELTGVGGVANLCEEFLGCPAYIYIYIYILGVGGVVNLCEEFLGYPAQYRRLGIRQVTRNAHEIFV